MASRESRTGGQCATDARCSRSRSRPKSLVKSRQTEWMWFPLFCVLSYSISNVGVGAVLGKIGDGAGKPAAAKPPAAKAAESKTPAPKAAPAPAAAVPAPSAKAPLPAAAKIAAENKLDTAKRAAVLSALVEGNSIRSTVRMTGAAKNTVTKLLVDLGTACARYLHENLRNLTCKRVQCDEIWSFCYAKAKNVPPDKKAIEIQHLLTHTSGLPRGSERIGSKLKDRSELVRLALALPLESRPGDRQAYSNIDYDLLAVIVELEARRAQIASGLANAENPSRAMREVAERVLAERISAWRRLEGDELTAMNIFRALGGPGEIARPSDWRRVIKEANIKAEP